MDAIEWGDAPGWAAVAIAILSAVIAVGAAISSHRNARRAHGSADRSAAAAERSADADQRMAELAEAAATKYRDPWRIDRVGNSRYLLVNDGDEAEYGVTIEGSLVLDGVALKDRVGPGQAVEFYTAPAYGDHDSTVIVRWFRSPDLTGDANEWRYPLP